MFNCRQTYIHNIVYKIINLKNNKEYIGVHSTNDFNDDYMGSGSIINRAISKHGIDSFSKEILYCFDSRVEALEKERELVNESYIKNANTYNLSLGGTSYIDSLNIIDSEKFFAHQSNAGKVGGRRFYDSLTKEERTEWHKKGRRASSGTLGKKLNIKDEKLYRKSRVMGALKRRRSRCPYCTSDKEYNPGNLKRHLKSRHTYSVL
jgi:hypothetical protein